MFYLLSDGRASISRLTVSIALDCHINLIENSWLVASRWKGTPSRNCGQYSSIVISSGSWETSRGNCVGEFNWSGKCQDGKVIVQVAIIVVGMVSNFWQWHTVKRAVINSVLSKKNRDTTGWRSSSAVSSSKHMLIGDQGTSTKWSWTWWWHKGHLPWILISLSLNSTNNSVTTVFDTTLAVLSVSIAYK